MVSAIESLERFRQALNVDDDEIDLALAALHIAPIEHPGLEMAPVLDQIDAMAVEVMRRASHDAGPLTRLNALLEVGLRERGIRGATEDYFNPRNSLLNDVLERRVGIPIALGVLLMSIGQRAGIPLAGTAMSMHFLMRVLDARPPLYLDGYDGGQLLTEEECRRRVAFMSQGDVGFDPRVLETVPNVAILERVLTNLRLIYLRQQNHPKLLGVLQRLLVLHPDNLGLMRARGILHCQLGNNPQAREDLNFYVEHAGNTADAQKIRELLRGLR